MFRTTINYINYEEIIVVDAGRHPVLRPFDNLLFGD